MMILATFGFNRTALRATQPKLHSMFYALFNIRAAIGEIQLHTIDNVLKIWTDRVGYCMASRCSQLSEIIVHIFITFQDEPNPTKFARARSTSKQMITYFSGKTGHSAIVPQEQRRTVNSEWHNHLFASCLPRNQKNQPKKTAHYSSRYCELSHIGLNNCIFEHSKHRFDESSAV